MKKFYTNGIRQINLCLEEDRQTIIAEGLPPVKYNIELKSLEAEYWKYQPQLLLKN